MSSLHIKAHLVIIRAVSIPAIIFRPLRIFKHFQREKRTPSFQLLMSWLYNYLESVFLQECIWKNTIKTNLKIKYRICKHSHGPLAVKRLMISRQINQTNNSPQENNFQFGLKTVIPLVLSQMHSKH